MAFYVHARGTPYVEREVSPLDRLILTIYPADLAFQRDLKGLAKEVVLLQQLLFESVRQSAVPLEDVVCSGLRAVDFHLRGCAHSELKWLVGVQLQDRLLEAVLEAGQYPFVVRHLSKLETENLLQDLLQIAGDNFEELARVVPFKSLSQ